MNNLTDLNYLKSFLKQSGLKPKHYLGQNFLVDSEVLEKIVQAAELKKTDTVLEVGPGLGVLTLELVKKAGRVIAVEKDEGLYKILVKLLNPNIEYRNPKQIQISNDQNRKCFEFSALDLDIVSNLGFRASNLKKVQLVQEDILRFHLDQHIQGPYKVVANIPYYLTSHLIQYFLTQKNKPNLMVLMVQKEVAERIVAKPGKLSILGISVQVFADAKVIVLVSKNSFWPVPEVDSAILRIEPKDKYLQITDHKSFFRIVKTAFAGKRKQLHNTLKNLEAIKQAGINPKARPQDLSIDDWVRLYKRLFL